MDTIIINNALDNPLDNSDFTEKKELPASGNTLEAQMRSNEIIAPTKHEVDDKRKMANEDYQKNLNLPFKKE